TGPRHLPSALAGLIVGGYGLGSAAGTLLGGLLADRWGRRRTLLAAHAGGAALLYALGLVHQVPVIAVLVALVGLSQGAPGPAFVAAIVDVVPEVDRQRAFNLQFWAFNLGLTSASLLAGLLAEVSFPLLFAGDATTTLVTAVLILLRVPETAPHRARPDAGPAERGGFGTALRDKIFLVFAGLALVQAMITTQSSTILPLAMRAHGLRPSAYGLVASLSGLLIVLGQLFVPGLIAGRRKGSVLALALAFLAAGYGSVTLAGSLPAYLAAATVWTAGQMLAAPPNATIMAELAPAGLRARYQAVFFMTFSLASVLAPALGGVSFQYLGRFHWLACAGLALLGAAGHLAASGPRERRVASAPQWMIRWPAGTLAAAGDADPQRPRQASHAASEAGAASPDR
ncbi:MAG TPA: MFS transporter, partial [Rugosimonospora sp.]|nr:MFS transporter [Rugosimonospora sp.]